MDSLIYDSVTGLELADRIRVTNGWQEFSFYRAIPRDGPFTTTIALAGMGEAWLDDITIQLIGLPTAQALLPQGEALLPRGETLLPRGETLFPQGADSQTRR